MITLPSSMAAFMMCLSNTLSSHPFSHQPSPNNLAITADLQATNTSKNETDNPYTISPKKNFDLLASIDVSSRADIFDNINKFEGEYQIGLLNNGKFVKWSFTAGHNVNKDTVIPQIKYIKVANSLEDLGVTSNIASFSDVFNVPSEVPCNATTTAKLAFPYKGYPFLASCKNATKLGGSTLMLYDGIGGYSVLGSHPLVITGISSGFEIHRSKPILILLAKSNDSSRIVVQHYRLD